jgi:hypothetical protein
LAVDAYRIAKAGSVDAAFEALQTSQRAVEITMTGPFIEELGPMSKDTHMAMRELPMLIGQYIHHTRGKSEKEWSRMATANELQPIGK